MARWPSASHRRQNAEKMQYVPAQTPRSRHRDQRHNASLRKSTPHLDPTWRCFNMYSASLSSSPNNGSLMAGIHLISLAAKKFVLRACRVTCAQTRGRLESHRLGSPERKERQRAGKEQKANSPVISICKHVQNVHIGFMLNQKHVHKPAPSKRDRRSKVQAFNQSRFRGLYESPARS